MCELWLTTVHSDIDLCGVMTTYDDIYLLPWYGLNVGEVFLLDLNY